MTPEEKEIMDLIADFSLEGVRERWGFHDADNPDLVTASVRDKSGAFIYLDTILRMLQESQRELAEALAAERERCCKEMCWRCKAGDPVNQLNNPAKLNHLRWYHGKLYVCDADPIRRLGSQP